jgi:hypothetical protein
MQIQFVVLCRDGTSYAVDHHTCYMEYGKPKEPRFDLGKLLASGWRPVRESGMGGGERIAYSLVVLEKE